MLAKHVCSPMKSTIQPHTVILTTRSPFVNISGTNDLALALKIFHAVMACSIWFCWLNDFPSPRGLIFFVAILHTIPAHCPSSLTHHDVPTTTNRATFLFKLSQLKFCWCCKTTWAGKMLMFDNCIVRMARAESPKAQQRQAHSLQRSWGWLPAQPGNKITVIQPSSQPREPAAPPVNVQP